jgi:hypothetical protein
MFLQMKKMTILNSHISMKVCLPILIANNTNHTEISSRHMSPLKGRTKCKWMTKLLQRREMKVFFRIRGFKKITKWIFKSPSIHSLRLNKRITYKNRRCK